MTTIVQLAFPASEVALAQTFDHVPGVRFAFEPTVATNVGDEVWLRAIGVGGDELRTALSGDPSVQSFELLDEGSGADTKWLVAIDFHPATRRWLSRLLGNGGTITEAVGHESRWITTCRYPDHDAVSDVSASLESKGIQFDVVRLTNEIPLTESAYSLTNDQYETVRRAYLDGYFDVPKETTLADIADTFDVTHQAVSERLRRGMAAVLATEFPVEDGGHKRSKPRVV